jgi:hypothetical protein
MRQNESDLTPQQRSIIEVWERHMRAEFVEHGADAKPLVMKLIA